MKKYFLLVIITVYQIVIAQNVNQISLVKVDVVGNTITSENTIIFTSGLREGTMVNPTDFPRAIKRLWQLGLFQDVQLQFEDETDNGLSLKIKVKENYILGNIKYEGNKKIKDSKFEEELGLTRGQRIKPNSLNLANNIIKDLYNEKGYLNAEISSELIISKDDFPKNTSRDSKLIRDIVFKISEKNKIKINKIFFKGNKSFSDFRLRWQLKETKQQPFYMFWRSTFNNSSFKFDIHIS